VFVGVLLLVWWVIGPAFFDDGWIVASQKNFTATGTFSTYYDSFGAFSSLQYWLQWPEHWLVESSNSLLILRLPALFCLAATWVLCRWILSRLSPSSGRAARCALASGFAVG